MVYTVCKQCIVYPYLETNILQIYPRLISLRLTTLQSVALKLVINYAKMPYMEQASHDEVVKMCYEQWKLPPPPDTESRIRDINQEGPDETYDRLWEKMLHDEKPAGRSLC